MGKTHVLVIPYPAQGHVLPMMELSKCLVKEGFKVTFVNSEHNHTRVMNAMSEKDYLEDEISLLSLPDGLEPWEDRNDLVKLSHGINRVMPVKLEELIDRINKSGDAKITCVIADYVLGWALEVAEKIKVHRAFFWSAAAALLTLLFRMPELMNNGIFDSNGNMIKGRSIQLAPEIPAMDASNFVWACMGDAVTQKNVFDILVDNTKYIGLAEWTICNSAFDLEPAAFAFSPNILPIGPLLARNRSGHSSGYFWPEDSTCLEWLDQQQSNSVIYVAFGSFTVFDQTQFQELALGLELCNRPFLWVVRPDTTGEANEAYPEGFQERVAGRGRMVGWAPQQDVLSHPSVALFLSHCGWNSTLEGVGNGVPFLCWPYFADQFLNQNYICDFWKVGLKFNKNDNGIITREEIKNKVEQVLGDQEFKLRAEELKEIAIKNIGEGGYSNKIFQNFTDWMKGEA